MGQLLVETAVEAPNFIRLTSFAMFMERESIFVLEMVPSYGRGKNSPTICRLQLATAAVTYIRQL